MWTYRNLKFKITFNTVLTPHTVWYHYTVWYDYNCEAKIFCSVKAAEKEMSRKRPNEYNQGESLKERMERSIADGAGLIFRIEKA
jgi:hypothetical protein